MDQEQQLFEALETACVNNDFETYRQLAQANIQILRNAESNFWRDLYSDGSRLEIKFWIEFEGIRQSIHNIALIPKDKDNLFYYALDYNIDMDGAENVIEMWREWIDEDPQNSNYLLFRIQAVENAM